MLSFAILILQLWSFTGIALLLHYATPRIGLAPMFFYLSAIITLLNPGELLALFIEPIPGVIIRTGAHVFVPVLLVMLLVLYVANGTSLAQLVLYAMTGVNALIFLVLSFILIYMHLSDVTIPVTGFVTVNRTLDTRFLRGLVASTFAFFGDTFIMVIFYQWIRNRFSKIPLWVTITMTLILSLWADSILYNVFANLGTERFRLWLPGDILAKTLAGLVVAPFVTYYLTVIAPKSPSFQGNEKRPTLDLLMGMFGGVKKSLTILQEQIHEKELALTSARERVKLLQDMVRDASHDLKSPVTSLLIKIHLLERAKDDITRARYLNELKNQSQQLSALIDDLFTLARLDSSRIGDKNQVNITHIGEHVYRIFYPIAEENQVRLEFTHPVNPILYHGIADEIERIFLNLVGNAIRYTREGKVILDVHENEDSVFITVKDTGIGIHDDDLPHIFNRFFRSKTAKESGIHGTGLGLPIVKTIVDLHHGDIQVESVVNVGTTFTIILPKKAVLNHN